MHLSNFTFISIPNNLWNLPVNILLLVYRDNIDEKSRTSFLVFHGPCFLMAVARKRLLKHIFAVSPSLPFDAVKTPTSLSVTLEIRYLLKSRNARLESFSTLQTNSLLVSCVPMIRFLSGRPLTITTVFLSDKLENLKYETECISVQYVMS